MQRGDAERLELLANGGAEFRRGPGRVEQSAQQCADPQPGAAGDDRALSPLADVGDRRVRELDESCGVQLLLWIGHVEQVVRRTRALLRRRLGGAGVESPVALRSEEHTSELQSQSNLVCRLLL